MFEHLGIIFGADGRIKNHRSVIKVLLNPLLRSVGLVIATQCDDAGGRDRLGAPRLVRHDRMWTGWQPYVLRPGERVEKRRRLI